MRTPPDFRISRFGDEFYPPFLKEISNPPLQLYFRGTLPDAARPHVAIVGTRKATPQGNDLAHQMAKDLAAAGVVLVSGLALGIDASAHEGALKAKGTTLAVLPVGIDRIYPAQHDRLADSILKNGGAIISEYEPGTPSFKQHFLARNRIVSGLCQGIIVIEAPERSGALATAAHALEQNREVFVVPGSPTHENYKGSHGLLRAGARLVTSAAEVLDDLNLAPIAQAPQLFPMHDLNATQQTLFDALKSAGNALPVDKIHDLTKIDISAVNQNLTLLLIRGIVKEEGGRYYLTK